MRANSQIIIIGSGPAGVSAAFPLVTRGISVLMLDGGRSEDSTPPLPSQQSLRALRQNPEYWKMMIGEQFQRLEEFGVSSPKFRVPTLSRLFSEFNSHYKIHTDRFVAIGSLAKGGLSNMWGAGVSMFDDSDLADFPISQRDLLASYRSVSRRIGVCGINDDLAVSHGYDEDLLPPVEPRDNLKLLYSRYRANPTLALARGIRIGLGRNAVLTKGHNGRNPCIECGLCLYGCAQDAVWSAKYDLETLLRHSNFAYRGNVFVTRLRKTDTGYVVTARTHTSHGTINVEAHTILLACGAIGSAKLVLDALARHDTDVSLLSSPVTSFAMLVPRWWRRGLADDINFALAQLTFRLDEPDLKGGYASGHFFAADTIPAAEFIPYLPFSYPQSRRIIRLLQPSLVLGNCYLSSHYSQNSMRLRPSGELEIKGNFSPDLERSIAAVKKRFAKTMRHYGCFVLPGSFRLTRPGEDVHYAGTVPMRTTPALNETTSRGEVQGLPGVYVVDGGALTTIPAKPHTLTIMANADRIARMLEI